MAAAPDSRPTSRRSFLGMLATAPLAGAALSACGTGTGGDGDGKTLRVQFASGGPFAPLFAKVGKDFEAANKGTTVKFEALDSNNSRGPNIALLSSSGTPDIGYLQRSTGVWSALLKQNQLTQIDDLWDDADLGSHYDKATAEYYTVKGHHYGVLFDQSAVAPVYYNKDIFSKAGLSEPANHQVASLDDWLDMADKLKTAGFQGLAVGGSSPFHLGHTMDSLLPTAVSKDDYHELVTNFAKGSTSTVTYTDPGVVATLKTIQDWNKAGVFQSGMTGMDYNQAQALFVGGKSAMLQGFLGLQSTLVAAKMTAPFGWFMLPSVESQYGPTPLNLYSGDTFVIPRKAGNPELAKKFLKFFMTEKYQINVVAKSGALPVFSDIDPSRLSALGSMGQEQLSRAETVPNVPIWDSAVPSTLGQAFSVPLLQKLVNGQTTPEAMAQQLQSALEDLQSGKVSGATD